VEIGSCSMIGYAFGLRFPKVVKDKKYKPLSKIIADQYIKRPIVILIEVSFTHLIGDQN